MLNTSIITKMLNNARPENDDAPESDYAIAMKKEARKSLLIRAAAFTTIAAVTVLAVKFVHTPVPDEAENND